MVFLRTAGASLFLLFCALLPARGNATLVSGQVTDAATGYLLQGAIVQAFESVPYPFFLQTTTTDASGDYQIDVPDGLAQMSASLDPYVAQTQFVSLDSIPQTADFALVVAGSIAGTVSLASTFQPLAHATISLLDAQSDTLIAQAETADDGTYSLSGINPAEYAVCIVDSSDVYLDICYNSMPISADGTMNFTPVTLADGQALTGIDFSMQTGATLSGTLHDSYFNVPIADAPIALTLYSPQQNQVVTATITTGPDGDFALNGLASGSYYLEAGEYFGTYMTNGAYNFQLYGGGECTGLISQFAPCPFASATLIDISAAVRANIDFDLFPRYVVTGKVTDAQTGTGIAGVTINSCDNPSEFLPSLSGTTTTDANGNYALAHVVGAQTFVAATDAPGYPTVLWPNAVMPYFSCASTSFYDGTQLNFSAPDQVLTDVNFSLPHGAVITGGVNSIDVPFLPVSSTLGVYKSDGQTAQLAMTVKSTANGGYAATGLAPGNYYVAAYFDNQTDCQLFDAVPCTAGWTPANMDVSNATPITLGDGEEKDDVDFLLKVKIFHDGFE
jgi:hypothetical protein